MALSTVVDFPAERGEPVSFSFPHLSFSLLPLFLSPLSSSSGSSNGTYFSLKTPAKSCSNHGFVETWHPVTVHSWLTANERVQLRLRAELPGSGCAHPEGKEPREGPLSRDREAETCSGTFPRAGVTGIWNHHPHPHELQITVQLLLGWKLSGVRGAGRSPGRQGTEPS